MATQVPTASEPGVTSLVKGIVNDIGDLIKQQFQFARAEIRSHLKKTGEVSLLFSIGLGTSLLGVLVLSLMLVHLLHWPTAPPGSDPAGLPLWACHGIVGGLFLLTGLGLAWAGKAKLDSFNPLPDRTVETMKENLQWKTNANSK